MSINGGSKDLSDMEKGFQEKLLAFSQGISPGWLDNNKECIDKTPEYATLIHLFPPLGEIFRRGLKDDPQEFYRTLVHTFQTQAAYNRICSGNFPESGLQRHALRDVFDLAHSLSLFSSLLVPTILWLHDIGRFEDKRRHNEKSAEMISQFDLLKNKGLSEIEKVIILKVIQYHLLIGTLYTGESSYTSFEPLFRDEVFRVILSDKRSLEYFLDSLTLFTMIDVWGYHISDISSTMIKNYLEIRNEMGEIFAEGGDRDAIIKGLKDKSRRHMDWRLMGYMMAFSKIGKKPHLTLDFYSALMEDGFKRYAEREHLSTDWNDFKNQYMNKIDQVQFKYGLGVLIPLTYGGTGQKMHLTENTRVNENIFHLLVNINNRIIKEEKMNTQCIPGALWNVVFKGYPLWNRKTDFHERLNETGQIEELIEMGTVSVDKNEGINTLSIDYGGFWKDI
ncbi:MAG: hypothetical protein SV375_05750 [Thermodesulfobacteriota bacterium]|nr:hypothetical protein [Thermodesulfobacteriota bacterium]